MQNKINIPKRGCAVLFRKEALQFVLNWPGLMQIHRIHETCIHAINTLAACAQDPDRYVSKPGDGCLIRANRLQDFGDCYLAFPDLAADLLNFLRKKWSRLEKSKSGKLQKFLSQNWDAKWIDDLNSREAVEEAKAIDDYLFKNRPNFGPTGIGTRALTEQDEECIATARKMWAARKHRGPMPDRMGNVRLMDLQEAEIAKVFEKSPVGEAISVDDVIKARRSVVKNVLAGEAFAKMVLDKDGYLQIKGRSRRRK